MLIYFWVATMLLLPFVCLYQIEEVFKGECESCDEADHGHVLYVQRNF